MSEPRKQQTKTNFTEVMADLNGGVYHEQVSTAFDLVNEAVVNYGDKGKSGKVVLTFDITRLDETNQVLVKHSLSYRHPTKRGKKSEDSVSSTPMHVGTRGRMTLLPDTQTDMFDTTKGKPER